MSEMVDTQVLCYAVADPGGSTPQDRATAEMHLASKIQLARMEAIRISAVTWFELCRSPAHLALLGPVQDKLVIDPIDGRVAETAARLVEACRRSEKHCPECWAAIGSQPCKRCGANLSRQQRINDALIVATASEARDVHTLYSLDGGVLSFGGHAQGVEVKRPPSPHGELFEALLRQQSGVISFPGKK